MEAPATSDLGRAALEYATNFGWQVFPCLSRGKKPATEHGVLEATTDAVRIEKWWARHPDCNIGVATGGASNLLVLDVDGAEGEKTLADLEAKHGALPETLSQTTGRGRHLIFRCPPGTEVRNSAGKLGLKLDTRGTGGYIVAAPSIHPSGVVYRWLNPDCAIADAPAWLLAAPAAASGNAETTGDGIAEGQRNDALFRLTRSLKLKGLSQTAILAAVLAENQVKCNPPLEVAEVEEIAANAFKQPDRAGFEVRDITALPSAIRECVLAPKVSVFDKKRGVFGLIRDALLSDGFLCRTPDGRLFYFEKQARRLYDLASQDFSFLLTAETGLSVREDFFGFALNLLQADAAALSPSDVHTLAHYDTKSGVMAVSDAGPGVWVRERGGVWVRTHNGENGLLFFTEPLATPWTPDFARDRDLAWFLGIFEFADNAPLTAADAKTLFTILLLQQFFPRLRRTRLLPAFLGQKGSGKSTKMRLCGRLILGPDFDVTNLREAKEDAFVAAITNSLFVGADNADSRVNWLEDALATYSTGLKYQLREYYTTNEQAIYRPRAILMLSSRDPHFRREDVAERMLPLLCKRPDTFLDEGAIYDELESRRGGIWGDLLKALGQAADAQQRTAPRFKFRMADFASFGWKVLAARGVESAWPALLDRLEQAQLTFAGEGNGLVETLRAVLASAEIVEVPTGKLFKQCEAVAKEQGFTFPRSANGFGQKLTNMASVIEFELDCKITERGGGKNLRLITLTPRVQK